MKFSSCISALLGAAVTATALPSSSVSVSSKQPASKYPIGNGKGPNAKVAGRVFDIDGRVGYFAGSNAWWLGHLSNNADVDISLQQVANTKYKVLRVWGFGDVNTIPLQTNTDPNKVYFQVLNSTGSYINYGADGLQRLDYVVSSAEKHGVKLVLNFVNNWGDFGGIAAYTTAFGANATQWFTDETSQQVYRNYIKVLVSRYRKSSAIFAWELANEPRCRGCDTLVITKWATEISKYIKSLDSGHMVTLGDEGWFAPADKIGDGSYAYGGGEGVDFLANLKIPTLDYGTFHLYPESWGYEYTWGPEWILQHDAAGNTPTCGTP
ncbi:glycoside hydrolase superfamily [Pseudomassariella vexata]|uniref:mannan endo-1,4-beta-mannosidase n=1 Tax=Pseudomassariella vexata TaxID=1141098 RepID=A0A1Y2DXX8_9PEZI|nr:glycoside hydrolase superfamily [Pseudomassariella vexata]ORY63485.1 glycoside hydrolase superfamily [Pseudomassariella vexata]